MFKSKVINDIMSKFKTEPNSIGESSSQVYKILNIKDDRNGYLKYDTVESAFGVNHEYNVIKFLKDKVKVADIYYYEYPYLITYELEGLPSFLVNDKEEAVKIIAKALKQLHSIDISTCNIYSQFEGENKIVNNDFVFVHGDACLPNFIIHNNEFNGFIDLGSAGIGNRYEDLALCTWSILYNFNEKHYVNIFFNEYGKEYYDIVKIINYLKLQDMRLEVVKDLYDKS